MIKLSETQEERARFLHERCLVFDLHSDISCEVVRRHYHGERQVLDRVFYPALRAGGVDALWISTPAESMGFFSGQSTLEGGENGDADSSQLVPWVPRRVWRTRHG